MKIFSILYKRVRTSGKRFNSYTYLGLAFYNGSLKSVYTCMHCSKYTDIYPNGLIYSRKTLGDLKRELAYICLCGPKVVLNDFNRKAYYLRYFKGFNLELVDFQYHTHKHTDVTYYCSTCNVTTSTSLSAFKKCKGCASCNVLRALMNRKWTQKKAESAFYSSGYWSRDHKIVCDNTINTYLCKFYCPICDTWTSGRIYDYLKGISSCACYCSNQKYLYINSIYDGNILVGYKYGIAVNPEERLKSQGRNSIYTVLPFALYSFKDSITCRFCESAIRSLKLRNACTKEEYSDGYTETFTYDDLPVVTCLLLAYNAIPGELL